MRGCAAAASGLSGVRVDGLTARFFFAGAFAALVLPLARGRLTFTFLPPPPPVGDVEGELEADETGEAEADEAGEVAAEDEPLPSGLRAASCWGMRSGFSRSHFTSGGSGMVNGSHPGCFSTSAAGRASNKGTDSDFCCAEREPAAACTAAARSGCFAVVTRLPDAACLLLACGIVARAWLPMGGRVLPDWWEMAACSRPVGGGELWDLLLASIIASISRAV